jgi:hypothetical protein
MVGINGLAECVFGEDPETKGEPALIMGGMPVKPNWVAVVAW